MGNDGLLRVAAASAAVCGVVALVTGSSAVAAVGGAWCIATAVAALRRGGRSRETDPSSGGIDLREPDPGPPPAPPVEPVAVVESNTFAAPQLLDVDYLDTALRSRIAVARRALRPLSVVHVLIQGTDEGPGPVPAELIAAAAHATLRESDTVGRRSDGVYVVILEDTGEDGAVWTAERLRRHVAGTIGPRRFQAGVAAYPNHGLDAETVDANAALALRAAQEWDRDRIEVAVHG